MLEAGWEVKLVLTKVKLDPRLETMPCRLWCCIRNKRVVFKVDAPKSLPAGYAIATKAAVVVTALVR